jgi:hypothetical protein
MRQWHLAQALRSVRSLDSVIDELTEEEVLHVLHLESGSSRRATVLDRLFQKAVDLNRQTYAAKLKEQYKWPASNP